jgi:hypothetical protein
MGFNMFCKTPNVFPNTFPIATHFIPYSLPQHYPLGTYIGEEPILRFLCSCVWTSVDRFSVLDPVLSVRIDWHLSTREPDWIPTSGSHMNENQLWEPFFMYICGESDRFSHRTQIRFSEFSVSFIGSSCSSSHLGLLLLFCCPLLFFSHCYYFSPIIILLSLLLFFLVLLLFSHYYCSLLIGITLLFITITFFPLLLFFSCCSDFSHMVLLFSCDEVI